MPCPPAIIPQRAPSTPALARVPRARRVANTSLREWRPFCPVTPRPTASPLPAHLCVDAHLAGPQLLLAATNHNLSCPFQTMLHHKPKAYIRLARARRAPRPRRRYAQVAGRLQRAGQRRRRNSAVVCGARGGSVDPTQVFRSAWAAHWVMLRSLSRGLLRRVVVLCDTCGEIGCKKQLLCTAAPAASAFGGSA